MTKALTLDVTTESLPMKQPFRISGHVFTSTEVVVVTIGDGTHIGRGEGAGVYYLADDVPAMLAAIESVRAVVECGITREQLRDVMPAGGGRNAIDSALWELEAKQTGRPVWELAGLDAPPRPLITTFTVGAADPQAMAAGALAYIGARAIKLKLTGDLALDIARVQAVRAALPDTWIGVDANQGFGVGDLDALVAALIDADIKLLEQPLARGSEGDLDGVARPIPFAADESALVLADVDGLVGRFDVVNIKLDKCGGLTEGLAIARAAQARGLQVMVGNMMGSSLSMAPSFILGQLCDVVDLDGPVFLARDRTPGIVYEDGLVTVPDAVWGRDA